MESFATAVTEAFCTSIWHYLPCKEFCWLPRHISFKDNLVSVVQKRMPASASPTFIWKSPLLKFIVRMGYLKTASFCRRLAFLHDKFKWKMNISTLKPAWCQDIIKQKGHGVTMIPYTWSTKKRIYPHVLTRKILSFFKGKRKERHTKQVYK